MKKVWILVVAAVLSLGFVGTYCLAASDGTAQGEWDKKFVSAKTSTVEGTVVSHDVKCHCIVIKGASGNVVVQDDYAEFNQEYNKAKGLKIGGKAKITYKTVDSINYATKVEQ